MNQLDNERQRVLIQLEEDTTNMKDLNVANRCYRKCVAGKCSPMQDRRDKNASKPVKSRKAVNFTSKRLQDRKLAQVWIERGREHRIRNLETELKELDTNITVASAKPHLTTDENNFKTMERYLKELDTMDVQMKKTKLEIGHLKSQLERVSLRKDELSRETESEGTETLAQFLLIIFLLLRSVQDSFAQGSPRAGGLRRSCSNLTSTRMLANSWESEDASADQGHAVRPSRLQFLLVEDCRQSQGSSKIPARHDRTL